MIKLIILDLDGVLVDAKEIHYEALNQALEEITTLIDGNHNYYYQTITREEHLSKYDGLNTTAKLDKLTEEEGLPKELHDRIFTLKQIYTLDKIKALKGTHEIYSTLEALAADYKLVVASNAIRDTVKHALVATSYINFVDFYLSNEDVKYPKPNSEMYLRCMIKAGVSPKETLIIEDSYNGRIGAERSGALVMGVNSPNDVTYENITGFLSRQEHPKAKWKDPKLNILIPMAGRGSRFETAGYTFPKPLIEVKGKPMIQAVVENLNIEANYIYLVQKEHFEKYNLKTLLNLITPNCKVVIVDGVTEGAACTTLLAKEYIDNDSPLLMANSDQIVDWDSGLFMYDMVGDYVDGGIVTFNATHPKWSFAKVNEDNFVEEVAEKNPISDTATVGIYFWKKGSDYVKYAEQMISKNIRTNNEFYVCPVFNEAIQDKKRIKSWKVNEMNGIGTPEDLNNYLNK